MRHVVSDDIHIRNPKDPAFTLCGLLTVECFWWTFGELNKTETMLFFVGGRWELLTCEACTLIEFYEKSQQ